MSGKETIFQLIFLRIKEFNILLKQIRDSAARIKHMYWLEEEINKGSLLTEVSVADKLEEIQK